MGTSARTRIRHGEGQVVELRLEVLGLPHPLWRRLQVSARASLLELHGTIQRALGQSEGELHAFMIDGVRYEDPDDYSRGKPTTDLVSLNSLDFHSGSRFTHEVETGGAPWHHALTVEQLGPRMVGQRLPACTDGGGANPPEECEGPIRYREVLRALDTPNDPWVAELREWLPEDFDPRWVSLTSINAELARLPKHRPAA